MLTAEQAAALEGTSVCYHLAVLDEAFWRSHKLESGYSDCNHNIRYARVAVTPLVSVQREREELVGSHTGERLLGLQPQHPVRACGRDSPCICAERERGAGGLTHWRAATRTATTTSGTRVWP
jgi:hypothetical protein